MDEITIENKITQTVLIELDNGSDKKNTFFEVMKDWVEANSEHKLDGNITKINVDMSFSKNVQMRIVVVKEDRLLMIEENRRQNE